MLTTLSKWFNELRSIHESVNRGRRRSMVRRTTPQLTSPETFEDRILLAAAIGDGDVDTSFASNGIAIWDSFPTHAGANPGDPRDPANEDVVHDVAVDSLGRTVAVGSYHTDDLDSDGFYLSDAFVVRFNPDGTLDTTFGQDVTGDNVPDGLVHFNFRDLFDGPHGLPLTATVATAVTIQPDGRIVVAGGTTSRPADLNEPTNAFVARLNDNGSFDDTFGPNHNGRFNFNNGSSPGGDFRDAAVADVTVNDAGQILIAGYAYDGVFDGGIYQFDSKQMMAARLESNGLFDTSFGDSGITTITNPQGFGQFTATGIEVANDGTVLLEGAYGPNARLSGQIVTRLLSNGTPDANFGTGGSVSYSLLAAGGQFFDVNRPLDLAPQADGTLLVALEMQRGIISFNPGQGLGVLHLAADGSIIPVSATDEFRFTSISFPLSEVPPDVDDIGWPYPDLDDAQILSDGSVITVGRWTGFFHHTTIDVFAFETRLAVARVTPDGILDTNFSGDGLNFFSDTNLSPQRIDNTFETAASLAIQPDGNLVLAATINTDGSGNESRDVFLRRVRNTLPVTDHAMLQSVPPVVIEALVHQVHQVDDINHIPSFVSDTVTFPGGGLSSGTFSGPGFSANIGSGDTIKLRFEAPAGQKFVVHAPTDATDVTFFVNAFWQTTNGDQTSAPLPVHSTTFENLVGVAPVNTYSLADVSDNGEAIILDEFYHVASEFSFTALQFEFVVLPGLIGADRTYSSVQSSSVPSFGTAAGFDGAPIDQPIMSIVPVGNAPPVAVVLNPSTMSVDENNDPALAIEVSTISVVDDGLGANNLSLSGPDAASFEIVGDKLRLKAGVTLDYESKSTYSVRVNADDSTVGLSPDAFVDFTLLVKVELSPLVSRVSPLPAKATSKTIDVTVTSSTVPTAAIQDFDLYVKIDSGAFTKFATVPAVNGAAMVSYPVSSNHTYFFYSKVRD
ncbi:MAG: hypothetical protein R3C59_04505 [Planctomycetaceae bacterium]